MDTKSKNYKSSYGMKTAAFLLALILGFSSAFFAIKAINNVYSYGSSIVLKPKDEADVTTSSAFVSQLMDDLQSVYMASGVLQWEVYRNQNFGSYEEDLKDAINQLETNKETWMRTAINRYQSMLGNNSGAYQYDSSDEEYETDAVNEADTTKNNSEESFIIKNFDSDYYYGCRGSISLSSGSRLSVSASTTNEELEAMVKKAYDSDMVSNKREFETKVNSEKKNIDELKNLNFYITNPVTGFVYSTMGDIDEKTAAERIKTSGWFLGYTVSDGLESSSSQVTTNTLYANNNTNYYYFSNYTSKNISSPDNASLNNVIENCFTQNGYNVYISLDTTHQQYDKYALLQNAFMNSGTETYNEAMVSLVCLLLLIFLSFYLLFQTGNVNGYEGVKLSLLDKIPTDIHFVASGGLIALGIVAIYELAYSYYQFKNYSSTEQLMTFLGMSILAAAVWAVTIEWLMSTVKYYKAKRNWIYSMVIVRILRWLVKLIKKIVIKITNAFKLFLLKPRAVRRSCLLEVAAYVAINFIITALTISSFSRQSDFWGFSLLLLLIAFNFVVLSLIWKYVLSLDEIISESEKTKSGEPPQNLSTEKMPQTLKTLANNLYYTQEEMSRAVGEAVKGEKMKTELITNVSHDLKTPLTSIISYVDLLRKCDIDDISAQKYITVLDEKSARLKRLIEDLVEASKASSGAVTFNKMNVNLHELAVQALAEMEDVFSERHLEIILSDNPNPPVIFADSQKTWRVIDNLLSNVRKYALEGTRVYVDINTVGDFGEFTIKNTSREALNIDPDELTNRFVRGDESRNAEGSGLGLSIAKDLCTLQGGELELAIDGDLFKATVKMPLAKKTVSSEDSADEKDIERPVETFKDIGRQSK